MSATQSPVARWTGTVSRSERGGFVAYGDYIELVEVLEAVKHGAEYPDELGEIINAALAKARGTP